MASAAVILLVMLMMFGMLGGLGYAFITITQQQSAQEAAFEQQLMQTQMAKQKQEEQKIVDEMKKAEEDKAKKDSSSKNTSSGSGSTASGTGGAKADAKVPLTLWVAADNEITGLRLNNKDVGVIPSGKCAWNTKCKFQIPTSPGDILEVDVANTGGPGVFRAVAVRGNEVYKTGTDFTASQETFDAETVGGGVWKPYVDSVWNPLLTSEMKAGLRDSKWIWVNSVCEVCTVTFTLEIPKADEEEAD